MKSSPRSQALIEHLLNDFERILPEFPLPEITDQHIFVTGGTGFIGYWLLLACHWLNERGANIRITLLSRHPARFIERHPEFRTMPWIAWAEGDVKNYPWPGEHFDAVIHGATDTSPAASRMPELYDDITLGTRRVLKHAVEAGARRMLLIGSGAVYGEQPVGLQGLPEDYPGLNHSLGANDAYGRGKRAMEECALNAAGSHQIDVVAARCFSFVGFGLPSHLAISEFIDDALYRDQLRITGDGRAVRSYLHAADLAVWLLTLLARGERGKAYNVGSPKPLSLLETAALVRDTLAPATPIRVLNNTSGAPRQRYIPDTRRIEDELKVHCWTPLEYAIRSTAKAIRLDRGSAGTQEQV